MIHDLKPSKKIKNNVTVFDFADLENEYVYIDDNHPPYRIGKLEEPATYYTDGIWTGCRISNFIVPLYPKIYLEAGEARRLSISLIDQLNLLANREILIKTFLTSSRSFKNDLALNDTLQADAKELLLRTPICQRFNELY